MRNAGGRTSQCSVVDGTVFYVPRRGLSRVQESGVTARATVIDIPETRASR